MKDKRGHVLLVEDYKNQRGIIRTILSGEGFYVEDVGTAKAALNLLQQSWFDVVISDLKLPDVEGTDILNAVR